MSLEDNIKKWVLLDNDIKALTEKIKQLKHDKNSYNANILDYISRNDLDNVTIKISDGKLKFIDVNCAQPLTYKFIYECLCKYFEDNETIVNVIKFIKSERVIKTTKEIKRYTIN